MLALNLQLLTLVAAPISHALPPQDLDQQYSFDGVAEAGWRLTAGARDYVLVLSRTGTYTTKPGNDIDIRSARLYANFYALNGDEHALQFTITDFVEDCPVDVTARFTDPAMAVSDLDKDGEPEIWVSYFTACRGDVSPATLKLIGYEGKQKFAMRGTARAHFGEHTEGGTFTADAALKAAPPAFLEFAQAQWMKVRDERF
jgi:hypothetical protein